MVLRKITFVLGLFFALNAAATAQQPLVPATSPSDAKVGDVVVTLDRCVLQNGQATTNLPNGVRLRVIALNADWVGCSVLVDGKEQRGWVKKWLVGKVPQAARANPSERQFNTAPDPRAGSGGVPVPTGAQSTEAKAPSPPATSTAAKDAKEIGGIVERVDAAKGTIVIVPWINEKKTYDSEHPRVFTFTEETAIEGLTTATVREIKTGKKVVKTARLAGISSAGLNWTKYEITNARQLLHERVTVYWGTDASLMKIVLVAMFAGESTPAMIGN